MEVLFLDTNMFGRLEREALPAYLIKKINIKLHRASSSQQANVHAQYVRSASSNVRRGLVLFPKPRVPSPCEDWERDQLLSDGPRNS